MQELRFVAVSEDGRYAVLAVPGRSARFTLPIDERLRAVALGQTSRLAQYEIEVESPLRPKEIQARIRAGETVEEIADSAGIPVERVRWFEGPVLAERAYVAEQARASSVRRPGDSTPGPRLGEITAERLVAVGADPDDVQWDARKRGDGNWQVALTFTAGGRLHVVEWLFDPRRRHVVPTDDNAARMSLPNMEPPIQPTPVPGAATVTQLTPRLRHEPADHGRQEQMRPAQPVAAPFTPAPAHVTPTATPPVPVAPPASASSGPAAASGFSEPEAANPAAPAIAASPSAAPAAGPAAPAASVAPSAPEPTAPPAPAASATPAQPATPAEPAARAAADEATEHTVSMPAGSSNGDGSTSGNGTAGGNAAASGNGAVGNGHAAASKPVAASAAASNEPVSAGTSESARRPAKKSGRGRRSSVPSWDEIILGSSREHD